MLTKEEIKRIIREMKMELEKIEANSVETGYERAKKDHEYSFVTSQFTRGVTTDSRYYSDDKLFENGNYMSEENAERMAKVTKLNFLLDRFTRENGWDDKLWKDGEIKKYSIYRQTSGYLGVNRVYKCKSQGAVYFISREIAEQAIKEFKELLEEGL